jgi:hypothetical protein
VNIVETTKEHGNMKHEYERDIFLKNHKRCWTWKQNDFREFWQAEKNWMISDLRYDTMWDASEKNLFRMKSHHHFSFCFHSVFTWNWMLFACFCFEIFKTFSNSTFFGQWTLNSLASHSTHMIHVKSSHLLLLCSSMLSMMILKFTEENWKWI